MSERVSKDAYLRVVANRPFKLSADEVNYREAEGDEMCGEGCMHFYTRKQDGYNVCEIFRDTRKKEEQSINPKYQCEFWTEDGQNFPLLED